jgi:hypothetical protein
LRSFCVQSNNAGIGVASAGLFIFLPGSRGDGFAVQESESAARHFGVSIRVMNADTERELEAAFVDFC